MSVYYTRKGDGGISRIGLKKFPKTEIVMDALGDLDELSSLLGIIKNLSTRLNHKILEQVQENLFIIQAHAASGMFEKLYQPPVFSKEKSVELEDVIEAFEKQLRPVKKFIIPGTNEPSAWFDYARTVARRTERSILKCAKKVRISPEILAYINRLSSLLFVMARIAAKKDKEQSPRYK